ncbi:hypothetical protein D3C72_1285500 [compost metagenome]
MNFLKTTTEFNLFLSCDRIMKEMIRVNQVMNHKTQNITTIFDIAFDLRFFAKQTDATITFALKGHDFFRCGDVGDKFKWISSRKPTVQSSLCSKGNRAPTDRTKTFNKVRFLCEARKFCPIEVGSGLIHDLNSGIHLDAL